MKKKGFTLIELLAVIVILAIIALIAVPIVLNIIEDSNKKAAEASMENIEEAAKLYSSGDKKGMIKTLLEVHEKMKNPPETLNEIHFFQLYGGELNEAEYKIKTYLDPHNIIEIIDAWDLYYSVYFILLNYSFLFLIYIFDIRDR